MQTPPTTLKSNTPITDGQSAKWIEVTNSFLRRNKIDNKEDFQAVLESPHLASQMDAIARKAKKNVKPPTPAAVISPSDSQERAKAIMQSYYFGIEEAATHFNAKWTPAQLKSLEVVPFPDEFLRARKDTHILVAGYPMTLLQVVKATDAYKAGIVHPGFNTWFRTEAFAAWTKVKARWYLISKEPLENSIEKSWADQRALIKINKQEIPTACVLTYATIGHYLVTGEKLFPYDEVRCWDLSSDGSRITFGLSCYDKGLQISAGWDEGPINNLGCSVSEKPHPML